MCHVFRPSRIGCGRYALGSFVILGVIFPAHAAPVVYVTNLNSNTVSAINTAGNTVLGTIAVARLPGASL